MQLRGEGGHSPCTPCPVILCGVGEITGSPCCGIPRPFLKVNICELMLRTPVPLLNSSRCVALSPTHSEKSSGLVCRCPGSLLSIVSSTLGDPSHAKDKMKQTWNLPSCYLGFGVEEGERRYTDNLRKGRLCQEPPLRNK